MPRTATLATLATCAVVLLGCAPPPVTDRVARSEDGWYAVTLPPGWHQLPVPAGAAASLAVEVVDRPTTQLVGSSFETADGAEETAILAAARLADGADVGCRRREDDTTFREPRLIFDCPSGGPEPHRKILVPIVDGDRSVLLLVQADGRRLADTAAVARPLLEGFAWR